VTNNANKKSRCKMTTGERIRSGAATCSNATREEPNGRGRQAVSRAGSGISTEPQAAAERVSLSPLAGSGAGGSLTTFQEKLDFASGLFKTMSEVERTVIKSVVELLSDNPEQHTPTTRVVSLSTGNDAGGLQTFQQKLDFTSTLFKSMSAKETKVLKSVVQLW